MLHKSVLLQEVIDSLSFQPKDVFLDATIGAGGHMEGAFKAEKDIDILGIDLDADAIARVDKRLKALGAKFSLFENNFRNLDQVLKDAKAGCANKILFDFGLSSHQIDESGRGFAFKTDEPLSMTMSKDARTTTFTAYDIVNSWDEENIADIIYAYGEERYARRIARAIVAERELGPVESTFELASIVEGAMPRLAHRKKINPATKTFQALRIAVNDELRSIEEGLTKAFDALCPGGRIAAISFHSLEDRIVKRFFRELEKEGKGRSLTKRPMTPSDREVALNPRSRSAKLRVFIKN